MTSPSFPTTNPFVPPPQPPSNPQYQFPTTHHPSSYQRQRRHSFQQARPPSRNQDSMPRTHEIWVPPTSRPRRRSLERTPAPRKDEESRSFFKEIASSTIAAINNGIVDVSSTQRRTRLYLDDASDIAHWRSNRRTTKSTPAEIDIFPMSTLQAAASLHSQHPRRKTGILNFASATSPGGGFLSGARAQEESIARSSTLYASLITPAARPFYRLHASDERLGFYTHSMIYSPDIYLLRDDSGQWLPNPVRVDVLTSPAVNAGDVRKYHRRRPPAEVEIAIRDAMFERMGRILALFERKGARQLVLGSFGTGVFQNDVYAMARLWHELLRAPGAPFAYSFDRVIFAIPDFNTRKTFVMGFDPAMVSDGASWTL